MFSYRNCKKTDTENKKVSLDLLISFDCLDIYIALYLYYILLYNIAQIVF